MIEGRVSVIENLYTNVNGTLAAILNLHKTLQSRPKTLTALQ